GAFLSLACSRGEPSKPAHDTTPAQAAAGNAAGADALMLRGPRRGGGARVVAYPAVGSTVGASSDSLAPLDRVLAFDEDAGLIAGATARSQPLWLDLRMGTVVLPTRTPVRDLVSQNGSSIFGLGDDGFVVVRFMPSGTWSVRTREPARAVFPQPN